MAPDRSASQLLLPNSLGYKFLDRFSIVDEPELHEDENGHILFWQMFGELLKPPFRSSCQVVELLETVAVTLRGYSGSAGDYGFLKSFIDTNSEGFFSKCWPSIATLALELPTYFPEGLIPVLSQPASALSLSRKQVAVLVAHQFLCTLGKPPWKEDDCYDFGVWYDSDQRHPEACKAYLSSLFT
jgi:poly(ADP-ribose) glycohydrolase